MAGRVPPNQTLLMKGLGKGVTRTQVSDFVRSVTPKILGVYLTTDLYSEDDHAAQVAFLNYASPPATVDAKSKLEDKVQALKGSSSVFSRVALSVKSEKTETVKHEVPSSAGPPPIAFAVWIANLVDEDSKQLKEIFEKYGELATGGYPPVKLFESSNRSAIVNFQKFEDAMKLIDVCEKRQLLFGEVGRGRMYAKAQPFSNTKFVLNLQNFFTAEKRDIITLKEAEQVAEAMGDHKPPRWMEAMESEFEVDKNKQLVCLKGSDALSRESIRQNTVSRDLYNSDLSFDPSFLFASEKKLIPDLENTNIASPMLSLSGGGSEATKDLTQEQEQEEEEEEDFSAILLGTYHQQQNEELRPNGMSSMIGPYSAFGPAMNHIGGPQGVGLTNSISSLAELNGSNTTLAGTSLLPFLQTSSPGTSLPPGGKPRHAGGGANGDGTDIIPPPFGPKEGDGNIVQWSVEDVCAFMRRLGFEDASARSNSIDGKTLVDLLHDAEGRSLILLPADQGGLGLRPLQLWRLRTEVKVALAARPSTAAGGASLHGLAAVGQHVQVLTASAAPERSGVGVDEALTRDPVTGAVMMDPVTASDGVTYDRSTVESVFMVFGRFPPSNAPATAAELEQQMPPPAVTPNKSVRNLIARLHPEVPLAPWRV